MVRASLFDVPGVAKLVWGFFGRLCLESTKCPKNIQSVQSVVTSGSTVMIKELLQLINAFPP